MRWPPLLWGSLPPLLRNSCAPEKLMHPPPLKILFTCAISQCCDYSPVSALQFGYVCVNHSFSTFELTIQYFTCRQKHTSYNKSVEILQQLVTTNQYQNAFTWLATACWAQVCCKVSTDWLQVDCQNLSSTGLLQCHFNRLVATWWNWQVCWNLLTSWNKLVLLTTSVIFLAV